MLSLTAVVATVILVFFGVVAELTQQADVRSSAQDEVMTGVQDRTHQFKAGEACIGDDQ